MLRALAFAFSAAGAIFLLGGVVGSVPVVAAMPAHPGREAASSPPCAGCAAAAEPTGAADEDASLLQFNAVARQLRTSTNTGAGAATTFQAEPVHIQCPGTSTMCQGDQCCPAYAGSQNMTFPCPSASPMFIGCEANDYISPDSVDLGSFVFDVPTAKAFAELAQSVYCNNAKTSLKDFSCASCLAATKPFDLAWPHVKFVHERDLGDGFLVMVAKLTAGADCAVSIRGTDTLGNWVRDFEFLHSEWKTFQGFNQTSCPSCEIEDGFGHVWRKVREDVVSKAREAGCHPHSGTNKLYVTGHSLGAAVAYIGMYDLADSGYDVVQAYLFEPPSPGNKVFSETFTKRFAAIPVWRITHYKDPFVHVPYTWMGYQRVAAEIYYPPKVAADDWVGCTGLTDPKCSFQWNQAAVMSEPLKWEAWHCETPLAPGRSICNPSYC